MTETQNFAKLKRGSDVFEIVIDPDKAMAFRKGIGDIRDVMMFPKIFSDAKKGMTSPETRLKAVFGTTDTNEVAKKIIADHYDVYLHKHNNPCSRTVCSHYELDAREYMSQADRPKPFSPHGAVDGMVCDTTMAKKMSFSGRFGSSCGIPFNKDDFCKKHIQWSIFCPYLKDRPSEPWTDFSMHNPKFMLTKKNRSKKNKTMKV